MAETTQLGFAFEGPAAPLPPREDAPAPPAGEAGANASGGFRPDALAGVPGDALFRFALAKSEGALVSWYLIESYARHFDAALLSDACFAGLCDELAGRFAAIDHRHKGLIDRAWLAERRCGLAVDAFPPAAKGAAAHLARTALAIDLPRD